MKATKEQDFRVCPNCGARNKAKWEYCVQCSESLQGVPLGAPAPSAAAAPPSDADDTGGLPWGSIFGTLIILAIGVGVYQIAREPAPPPPAELFTIGTVPPSLPPAPAVAERSGAHQDYLAGVQRLNANDPGGAVPLFARAVAASDNHVYRHAYAVALWQSGSREQAMDEYRSALRAAPDNPTYRLNLARALTTLGRTEEAISEYEVLLQRPGNHLDALQEASRLMAETEPARAQELLRRAAAARPEDMVLRQQLAGMLEKSGDVQGASQMYTEVLTAHPEAHITRGLLAEIQIKSGQPQEAIALFRSGLQQYPDVPLLHRGLASALERSGAVTEAITEYREYARLAPNAPDAQQLRERADRLEKQAIASAS